MAIPTHWLHVFQRPAQGSAFIKRYPIFNYQHSISNQGWFDTASGDIAVQSETEGQQILEQYLGTFVQIYVDNPAQPIWEGLINRITFNAGSVSYTISLDELANRVSVVYTAGSNAAAETVHANNTASQAIYGIKHEQIEMGSLTGSGTATQHTLLRDAVLAQKAFPQVSCTAGGGQANTVHFECVGIYQTLAWLKVFTVISATTSAFGTVIAANVTGNANGATFFDNANTTLISANGALTPDQQRAQSTWERIWKIAEAGDGTNVWVCGITPTDFNRKTRIFYYRVANTAIEYTARQSDGLKPRNLYGKVIPPWLVTPDRGIQITDTLVGFGSSIVTDPRQVYIQNIQYNANQQSVQWFGSDDTTMRGAFLLKRGWKPLGRPLGAPLRTLVT